MKKNIKLKPIVEEIQNNQHIRRQKELLQIAKKLTTEMKTEVQKEYGV